MSLSHRAPRSRFATALVACLLSFALAVVPGCKACSSDATSSAPDAAPSTVTPDLCARWVAHGVDVIVEGFKRSAAACPDAQRREIVSKWETSRAFLRSTAGEYCAKSGGKPYDTAAGECYLAAKTISELASCHFDVMTSPGDSDIVAESDAVAKQCRAGGPPPAPAGSAPGTPL